MAAAERSNKHRTICVREEFKIAVKLALDKFRFDDNQKVLELPSSFTALERAYVHRFCQGLGLNSKSRGRGNNRFLTVTKKDISSSAYSSALKLTSNTCQLTDSLFKRFPLNSKERQELQPKTERSTSAFDIGRGSRDNKFSAKLSGSTPQVPPPLRNNELTAFRQELPIFGLREQFLKMISEFQVVLVSGETGSGKTTQVPQYILEHATETASSCRVVCTQPRRISAISVAERVAGERGERLGQVVGYQIRLESRVSPRTLLTYCTNGVLLRALMSGDNTLSFVTHVIVDEIHERDKFSDFLLISLRDLLAVNKKLKLILMSAAMDINLFRDYFGNCPVLHVPGRCHDVKPYFLEDVLKMTSYTNKEMEKHLKTSLMQKMDEDIKKNSECEPASASSGAETSSTDEHVTVSNEVELPNKKREEEGAKIQEDIVLEQVDDVIDVETDDVFEDQIPPSQENELDEDTEAKLSAGVQEEFEPEFVLEEEVEDEEDLLTPGEGTPPEEGADMVLEDEEEEEQEEEDNEEEEEGESVKDLAEEFENAKLEDEVAGGEEETHERDSKQEEVQDEENEFLRQEMDSSISEAWLKGDEESFVQILHLVMNEDISVDYQHSETQATSLMVASGRGCLGVVEQLLSLGANPHIREPKNGWMALDWAKKWEHSDVVDHLESFMASPNAPFVEEVMLEKESDELNEETKELLSVYHKTFDDDRVDLDLICSLLRYICSQQEPGAILVFLPGYDEIINLRDRLFNDKEFGNNRRYQVFVLHSSLQPSEQRKVFRKLPSTVRKIVLSTNIAETSITIDDVVYVIDSGKVKEKYFDALTSVSMLQPVWVSKASAIQRRGRAGRCSPGQCFHLFSRVRFESFQEYQVPELLRVPLQELCLHAKLLTGPNTQIADFLAKAPEPPAYLVMRNAVTLLKTIDALDKWEDLTDIGRHLVDLPVEPRLGKMVLYSLVLKCLDPIVTIVCALAYRNPFVLPLYAADKRAAAQAKRRFVLDAFSDHLTFVRVFNGWQRARAEGYDKNFCRKNFLSQATLEMMAGMRSQLLNQLKSTGFIRTRGAGDIRDINSNSNNWAVVKAVLCAGIFPQIARLDRSVNKLTTQKEKKVRLHKSSIFYKAPERGESIASSQATSLSTLPSDWLVYEEMTRMYTTVTVKCCTVVSSLSVALFTGPSLSSETLDSDPSMSRDERRSAEGLGRDSSSDSENEDKTNQEPAKDQAILKIDDWISLSGRSEFVKLASFLRHKLQALFVRRIRSPSRPWSQVDEAVVRAVVAALTSEEQAINPSLYPPQKRRAGFESGQDKSGRLERVRVPAERFSPTKERPRDPNGSGMRMQPDGVPLHQDGCRRPMETSSSRPVQPADRLGDARYFIMKCNNQRNLDISMAKGIWATTLANEKKLNRAYKECKRVHLVFSVQGSGHFQGYAEMTSPIGKDKSPEFGSSSLSGVFTVNWIKKANIPFQQVHQLVNPWNDNKKVQISRDGQELEPNVGAELCNVWDSLDASGNNGRFSRPPNNNARRGKPTNHTEVSPPHWSAPTPYGGQQVYIPHAASMPIPVPIPSRHAMPQTFSRVAMPAAQPMAIRPQSPVQFGGQAMHFQPHMRSQPPRYGGTVMQVGPASGVLHVMRPNFNSPRK